MKVLSPRGLDRQLNCVMVTTGSRRIYSRKHEETDKNSTAISVGCLNKNHISLRTESTLENSLLCR